MKPSMVLSHMVKMVQVTLTVAILIGIVPLAFGQMYKWLNEKGTVHFTDDLSNIPEKYRTEAESRKVPKETLPPPSPHEAEAKSPSLPMDPEPERFEVNLTRKYGVWLAEVALLVQFVRRNKFLSTLSKGVPQKRLTLFLELIV